MFKQITKLVDVKSIVTLVVTGAFTYLSVIGKLSTEQFMTIFVMIMTFYFTKKDKPTTDNKEDDI